MARDLCSGQHVNGLRVMVVTHQVVLNAGCFQVPLKWAPPAGQTIHHGILHAAPPVPCASLLIRITPVSSAASSTPCSMPLYESGAYDSTMCAFSKSDEEKALVRAKRPNVRVGGTATTTAYAPHHHHHHHTHLRTSPTTTTLAGVFGQWCNDKRAANEAAKGGGPAVEEWLQEVFTNRDPRGKPLRAFLDPTPDA
jgi:hypothetical protein